MPKKARSMRLGNRTWDQLEELAGWCQVEDRTRVVEILAEREHTRMKINTDKDVDKWLQEKYPIGGKIQFEHPEKGIKEATVISHITGNRAHPTLADGVRLQFEDGEWFDVPVGRLGISPTTASEHKKTWEQGNMTASAR